MSDSRWRAVYCKPRQERRAEAHLENQGFEVFLPRVRTRLLVRGRSRVRVEPMFPRYLFVALEKYIDNFAVIRSTRGVAGLVRFGDQFPALPGDFVAALRRRHDDSGAIDITSAFEIQPDDRVEITDGAMAGLQAIYRAESGHERVLVMLDLLNNERSVEVPRAYLRKVV